MMYDRDGHDWGWGTWLGMGLMMAVLTAMVVAAGVLAVRSTTGPEKTTTSVPQGTPQDTPLDSAAQRVADAPDPHPARPAEDYPPAIEACRSCRRPGCLRRWRI